MDERTSQVLETFQVFLDQVVADHRSVAASADPALVSVLQDHLQQTPQDLADSRTHSPDF